MPSSPEALESVVGLLESLGDISHRKMMGEYLLYYRDVCFGGIYDDRLLIKVTPSSKRILEGLRMERPYEGAKEMIRISETSTIDLHLLLDSIYRDLSKKPRPSCRTSFLYERCDNPSEIAMKTKIKASRRAMGMNYAIREVAVPAAAAKKAGMDVLDLNIGDPNKWGFETPEYFKATLRAAVDETDNGYGDSQGSLDLREAIVQREYEKHGARISSDDVYVTAGVSEAINVMMGTLIEPGDEILVPGPGYPSYEQYINFYEGRTVPYRQIEEEDWRPDVDMIRKRITNRTKALIVINPNNPTGAIYDEKTVREMGDIAAEYSIPLISDEIYDKIIMEGTHFSASQLPDDIPRIIFNGFSKVNLMPGWRMGYTYFMDSNGLLDEVREGLMKQFRARICANVPCQAAARASLQGPQDYIVDLNRKLKERADYTYKRLNEIQGFSTRRAKGAFYMFPSVELKGTPWKTDKDLVLDLIKEEGLVLVHGSGFCPEFGSGHVRTITLPPVEVLEEAYDRLEHFMSRHAA